MSAAQVTEAHLRLANQLVSSPPSPLVLATLIADSEAKATAQLRADRDYNHECINRLASATGTLGEKSERVVEGALSTIDQLRAEVERLKPYVSKAVLTDEGTMPCSPMVAVKFNEETARAERAEAKLNESRYETVKAAQEGLRECIRAERAEAELANIRALADRRNKRDHSADTNHQLVAALDQALDIAQAELAAERARLDWVIEKILADSRRGLARALGHKGDMEQVVLDRAAIDAAMKEEIK